MDNNKDKVYADRYRLLMDYLLYKDSDNIDDLDNKQNRIIESNKRVLYISLSNLGLLDEDIIKDYLSEDGSNVDDRKY